MPTKKITVLLVDDHAIVRQGIRKLLEAVPDIEIVGEAGNGRQAVQLANTLRPEVVLMDMAMPVLNGLEATRQILQEGTATKVIMLSAYSDTEFLRRSIAVGAAGYLIKKSLAEDVVRAIREAHCGNAYYCPAVSKAIMDHYRETLLKGDGEGANSDVLTTREAEVLQLIAEGRPNKQIADELQLNVKTVEKHRQQLMNKLKIHHIAGLTRYAISTGVLEAGVAAKAMSSSPSE